MHSQRTNSGGAATVIALAFSIPLIPSIAADEHPLVGTWSGAWKSGLTIELTVDQVAGKAATGLYCNIRTNGAIRFVDLSPDHGITATVNRKGRLKYKIGKTHWEYRPDRRDPDRLQLHHRRGGKTTKLDVHRVDPDTTLCAGRVATLSRATTGPRGNLAPSDHPLVGVWRGEWDQVDAATEIAIWSVDVEDSVQATYCHRHDYNYFVSDLRPGDVQNSRIEADGTLRFHGSSNPDVKWVFTLEDSVLEMEFLNRRGRTHKLALERTSEPVCLARVAALPENDDA